MHRRSPTLEGFKVVFRQPSLALAEIAWRWSIGAAGIALLLLSSFEYFDTLPVTAAETFLLRSGQPVLVYHALGQIFRGSGVRAMETILLVALGFLVAWVVVGSLGRSATIHALLAHFAKLSGGGERETFGQSRGMLGLNFLRAAVVLATAAASLSAFYLAGAASPDSDPSPGSALLVFTIVLSFIALAWAVLNWFLSLASIFVISDRQNTLGAIAAAVGFFGSRLGPVWVASFWFGFAHLGLFAVISVAAILVLSFLAVLPAGIVMAGIALLTLVYFAVADFLYISRLASYVYIAVSPASAAESRLPSLPPPPPAPAPSLSLPGGVDADELILSDLPLPASS